MACFLADDEAIFHPRNILYLFRILKSKDFKFYRLGEELLQKLMHGQLKYFLLNNRAYNILIYHVS